MVLSRRTMIFLGLMAINQIVKRSTGSNASSRNMNSLNLPSFANTFVVKSSQRGRVRFEVPIIKNNVQISEFLISQLKNIDVIKKAEINIYLGTILVCYDDTKIDAETVEGVLMKILKLDEQLKNRVSVVRKKCRGTIEALNSGIYDYSKGILDIKTIVLLYFMSKALLDLKLRGRHARPDYMTLMWWGSSLIS